MPERRALRRKLGPKDQISFEQLAREIVEADCQAQNVPEPAAAVLVQE